MFGVWRAGKKRETLRKSAHILHPKFHAPRVL